MHDAGGFADSLVTVNLERPQSNVPQAFGFGEGMGLLSQHMEQEARQGHGHAENNRFDQAMEEALRQSNYAQNVEIF